MGNDLPNFIPLPTNPLDIQRHVLQTIWDGATWSQVMRSILMYEINRVQSLRDRGESIEPRTLRSLWYTLVKPALDKWGALDPMFYNEGRVKNVKDLYKIPDWDKLMSKYLAELVRLGVTTYEELGIIDGSRQREAPHGTVIRVNDVDIIGVHYPNVLLFTEKDTIYPIIENIASIYGVGVLSGSGKPSFAATENLINKMTRHSKFRPGDNIYVLTLTDYDPSGYIISDSQVQQITEVVAANPDVGEVVYQRLGIVPEQLSATELRQNVYTPARSGLEKWFEETGGVNGEPLGIELDALPVSRIREMFVDGIEQVIPSEAPYHQDLAEAFVDLLIWEALEDRIKELREKLFEQVDGEAIVGRLRCPSDTLAKFARLGANYINPVQYDSYVFNEANSIRRLLQEAVEGI